VFFVAHGQHKIRQVIKGFKYRVTHNTIYTAFGKMDDFVLSNLQEAKNEWCSRLVSIFTPLVIEGIRSIFNESWKMCVENDEAPKYLMTFQNLLCRVPKWNSVIVEEERKRIIERSSCGYLEDLITCVHIIQLKVLTCIRVGNKQKKIDISIPKLDHFIHKVYIHVARKVYMNVYLFEKNISPLLIQKNNRELEMIVQECILMAIRDSIPTEAIIRAYMDETVEQEEEVIIEPIEDNTKSSTNEEKDGENDAGNVEEVSKPIIPDEIPPPAIVPAIQNVDNEPVMTRLSFTDYDKVVDSNNHVNEVSAPKTIERLEQIATANSLRDRYDSETEDAERIRIHTNDNIDLDMTDFDMLDESTNKSGRSDSVDSLTLDFEEL
jgi:hypothetical protein